MFLPRDQSVGVEFLCSCRQSVGVEFLCSDQIRNELSLSSLSNFVDVPVRRACAGDTVFLRLDLAEQ